jgi:hypothetical protein
MDNMNEVRQSAAGESTAIQPDLAAITAYSDVVHDCLSYFP